jgi:hypothetical protein
VKVATFPPSISYGSLITLAPRPLMRVNSRFTWLVSKLMRMRWGSLALPLTSEWGPMCSQVVPTCQPYQSPYAQSASFLKTPL